MAFWSLNTPREAAPGRTAVWHHRNRSWLAVNSGHDQGQGAFVLNLSDPSACELRIKVAASKNSPVYSPALVILAWDISGAALTIDGKRTARGQKFRVGQRHGL